MTAVMLLGRETDCRPSFLSPRLSPSSSSGHLLWEWYSPPGLVLESQVELNLRKQSGQQIWDGGWGGGLLWDAIPPGCGRGCVDYFQQQKPLAPGTTSEKGAI